VIDQNVGNAGSAGIVTAEAFPDGWWQALVEQAPLPMSVVDIDGRQLIGNRAYADLFGYDIDELHGLDIADLTAPADQQRTAGYLRDLAAGTPRVRLEKWYVRRDGSMLRGRLTASPLRDRDGRVHAFLGFIEDLTGQDDADRARLGSEVRFRAVLTALKELVCEWDHDGTITFVNDAYCSFFGVDPDIVGRTLFDLIPADAVEQQHQVIEDLRAGRSAFHVVRTYEDGRSVSWSDTVLRDEAGRITSIVSVGRDITASVVAEEVTARAQRRLELLLANVYDSVLLLAPDASIVASSGSVRTDLGYPPGFWETANPFSLLHPDDLDAIGAAWADMLARPGVEMSREARLRMADGGWADVELDAVNLLTDPDVGAVVLTARNITRRKAVESELALRHAEAVEQSQRRSALIATVSHELRNPLHGLLGLAELLSTSDLPGREQELARLIHGEAAHLRHTVDDLLDLGSMQASGLRLELGRVALHDLATTMAQGYQGMASPGVRVSAIVADVPAAVRADEHRLRQLIENLLSNAVKFTTHGSIELRLSRAAGGIRIDVADTGRGLPQADLEHIFDAFVQVPGHDQGGRRGAGLGLAIVRTIATAMGGSVSVTSTEGEGSTFTAVLPVEPCADDVDGPGRSLHSLAGLRVLVVDDDSVNRLVAQLQLERLGVTPEIAETGAAALDVLDRQAIDLVLMDYQLPDLDGPTVTRMLRARQPDGPVVVGMTASAGATTRQVCLEAGMDDFLAKPVGLDELRTTLERWSTGASTEPDDGAEPVTGVGSAPRVSDGGSSTSSKLDASP
jgi:PAS domain S-box-containing protein